MRKKSGTNQFIASFNDLNKAFFLRSHDHRPQSVGSRALYILTRYGKREMWECNASCKYLEYSKNRGGCPAYVLSANDGKGVAELNHAIPRHTFRD